MLFCSEATINRTGPSALSLLLKKNPFPEISKNLLISCSVEKEQCTNGSLCKNTLLNKPASFGEQELKYETIERESTQSASR